MTALDTPVAHGYTLDDLDHVARAAVRIAAAPSRSGADRYRVAWDAATFALLEAGRPLARGDLIRAAAAGISAELAVEAKVWGLAVSGKTAQRYGMYWLELAAPSASPEGRVVESVALTQIWPTLTDAGREALMALAAFDGDQRAAAHALGLNSSAFTVRLSVARRRYLAAWHEGETPPPRWRLDAQRSTDRWSAKNRTRTLRPHGRPRLRGDAP